MNGSSPFVEKKKQLFGKPKPLPVRQWQVKFKFGHVWDLPEIHLGSLVETDASWVGGASKVAKTSRRWPSLGLRNSEQLDGIRTRAVSQYLLRLLST